ncbi:MAG: phospholipase D-like domain-containing protein [Polyangiaceae bacterium]
MHAKLVMADRVPFVGSQNLSTNALENNREIGVVVTEPAPAATIAAQFEADWAAGTVAP